MPLSARLKDKEPKAKKAKVTTGRKGRGKQAAAQEEEGGENLHEEMATMDSVANSNKENVMETDQPVPPPQQPLDDVTMHVDSSTTKGVVAAVQEEEEVDHTKPGVVLSVGENVSNQLGLGDEISERKKPQVVKLLPTNIIQVVAGGMHSACLSADGLVYTFGCNDEFALGRDNDNPVDKVDLCEKIVQISAGDSHTAALGDSGAVYAWGTFRDGSGVLGLEEKQIAKTPFKFNLEAKIVKISSGADHLVFLTDNGEVYTAGNSEHGQLGRVSKYNCCRGGRRGCDMILVPGLVRIAKRKELNKSQSVQDIWTTPYCTFLSLKDTNLLVGFGLNNANQLGTDDIENRYQPEILPNLKFDSKIVKIVGGMHHTLFLDEAGHVYSLGSHRYGSLGCGKTDTDASKPKLIDGVENIVSISANTNVSYATDKYGKCFSWGTNYSKQLGHDDEDDYWTPLKISSKQVDVRNVHSASVGGQHTLFVMSEEKEKM